MFLLGNAWVRKRGGGKKRKKDAAKVQETHSSHFLPSVQIHEETDLTGARGKQRGVSPGDAARPLDRTRVMRIVARGESPLPIDGMTLPSEDSPQIEKLHIDKTVPIAKLWKRCKCTGIYNIDEMRKQFDTQITR